MSSPGDYYKSLPPVSKAYGTLCLLTTLGFQLGLLNPYFIYMDYDLVLRKLQVWRLITNFLFLGKFSINFGIRLLMIARYGVQLEVGPFAGRTPDFLWMMMFSMLTLLGLGYFLPAEQSYFLGPSVVFMLLYVWSREFANARVNISGLFTLQGFYLPWAMFALNTLFGSPLLPDLLGIVVGHLFYFLTVLHPRAGGQNILKTPSWVHKLVRRWNLQGPQGSTTVQQPERPGSAFTGRSYRLSE